MTRECMVNTHLPKAPTFRLLPIQAQPNLHEIQQPKLQVVPRGRHPPIIVSSTEQASHRSGERKRLSKKRKIKKDITLIPENFLDDLAIERRLRQVRKWATRELEDKKSSFWLI